MRHRIFIAINFPSEIREELLFYQRKWQNLPVRWIKKENLHLTLIFLGYVDDQFLLEIFEKTKKVAKNHQPFSINFNRICLGPPKTAPRLFWIEGQKSQKLSLLRDDLEKELAQFQSKEEVREFKPHITLGRIKMEEWRKLQKKPKIEEKISLNLSVNSVEIMESQLKREGAEYTILESFSLGKED